MFFSSIPILVPATPSQHEIADSDDGAFARPINSSTDQPINRSENIVVQEHRAIKRIVRLMLGFKSFWCAARTIAGIETMHVIRKGQFDCPEDKAMSAADQFYSLAA